MTKSGDYEVYFAFSKATFDIRDGTEQNIVQYINEKTFQKVADSSSHRQSKLSNQNYNKCTDNILSYIRHSAIYVDNYVWCNSLKDTR